MTEKEIQNAANDVNATRTRTRTPNDTRQPQQKISASRMSRTRSVERVPPTKLPHPSEELCETAAEQTHTDDDVECRDIPSAGLAEREEDGRRAEREEATFNDERRTTIG